MTPLFCLLALACGHEAAPAAPRCPLDAAIEPGCGIVADGHELRLGDSAADLDAALGAAVWGDLGALGRVAAWPQAGVESRVDPDGTVVSLTATTGFGGQDPEGHGLGSTGEAVRAAHPQSPSDPVLHALWDRVAGVTYSFQDDVVSAVQVFRAGS